MLNRLPFFATLPIETDMARQSKNRPQSPAASEPLKPLGTPWKWLISVLLIFHLVAVFAPPFHFMTISTDNDLPPISSPVAENVSGFVKPYVDVMNLNHGYAFFAPNPGPGHLVEYELEFAEKRPTVKGTFPDLKKHWPRLLYHRHFMLSEQLYGDLFRGRTPTAIFKEKANSYQEHLKSVSGAKRVRIRIIEHALLTPQEFFVNRIRLNDPMLYRTVWEEKDPTTPREQEPTPLEELR